MAISAFETYTSGGQQQFNDSQSPMALVYKTTIVVPSGAAANGFSFSAGTFQAPILVWESDQPVYWYGAYDFSGGGAWQPTFNRAGGAADINITVWIFDYVVSKIAPSNVGLQLFDPAGTLIYDAVASQPMRPVSTATPATSIAIPTGKRYALAYSQPVFRIETVGSTHYRDPGIAYRSGNTIITDFWRTFGSSGSAPPDGIYGNWLVVDVTNL